MGLGTITSFLRHSSSVLTCNASSETVQEDIFALTGAVVLWRLWGEITVVLGSNHTAASFTLNDQTATVQLTSVGGQTFSNNAAGSLCARGAKAATAIREINNVAVAIQDAQGAGNFAFTPVALIKKSGAETNVQYKYSTTNAPTTGEITFYAEWYPLSADGLLE